MSVAGVNPIQSTHLRTSMTCGLASMGRVCFVGRSKQHNGAGASLQPCMRSQLAAVRREWHVAVDLPSCTWKWFNATLVHDGCISHAWVFVMWMSCRCMSGYVMTVTMSEPSSRTLLRHLFLRIVAFARPCMVILLMMACMHTPSCALRPCHWHPVPS